MRFGDHRKLKPSDITVKDHCFLPLKKSKTICEDRQETFWPVYIDSCCFVSKAHWVTIGWNLVRRLAGFPRDYLFPTPSANYQRIEKGRDEVRDGLCTSEQSAQFTNSRFHKNLSAPSPKSLDSPQEKKLPPKRNSPYHLFKD